MFTTFSSNSSSFRPTRSTNSAADSDPLELRKAKRSQVGQACENCRAQRIKCDNEKPCTNCNQKGIECILAGGPNGEPRRRRRSPNAPEIHTSSSRTSTQPKSVSTSSPGQSLSSPGTDYDGNLAPTKRLDTSFRGLFRRINDYAEHIMVSAGLPWDRTFCDDVYRVLFVGDNMASFPADSVASLQHQSDVTKRQRAAAYTVQVYWHSFHVLYPILQESAIRTSLFKIDDVNVPPTPLLDVGLALCQQLTPQGSQHTDGRPEGWDDYIRFELRMANNASEPSLLDLQALTMATVYLERAGRSLAASSKLSTAIHVARAIRDNSHSQEADSAEKILRARIWLCLYVIDTRISRDLGCQYQLDDKVYHQNAALAGLKIQGEPEYSSSRELTNWLVYHVSIASLMQVFRDVQRSQHYQPRPPSNDVEGWQVLEQHAKAYNRETLVGFITWREGLPKCLITPRVDSKPGMSLHSSPMQIDFYSPMWIQRQRFSLELLYHEIKMSLYFAFFRFPHNLDLTLPVIESHQNACVQHAIVNAVIIDQIVSHFDAVEGAVQLVRHLFRAAECILAFLLVQPGAPLSRAAYKALQTTHNALTVLEKHCRDARVLSKYLDAISTAMQAQTGGPIFDALPSVLGEQHPISAPSQGPVPAQWLQQDDGLTGPLWTLGSDEAFMLWSTEDLDQFGLPPEFGYMDTSG